ncbi:MAG TPA: TPM domain-containing protein [Candidatus Solibacter sp.]|nr:TPM domain-containing protein [Candidatus Solibacter sp.]
MRRKRYNLPVTGRRKLISIAAAILLSIALHAEKVAELKPTGYVNDFAGVIDSGSRAQIEDMCRQVDEKAHAQIALVTINTLDDSDIESFAVDLFKKWGVGAKATDRGVLILYAIKDHKARIEVGYGLEPILPDGKVGGFQREAIPLMRSGEYSAALSLVTSRVADVIASDAGVELTGKRPRPPTRRVREPDSGFSLGGVIVLIVIFLIILATPLRSLLFWLLFSNIFGGRGGFGGGGFGGGGFGGFGGGGGGGWSGGGGGGFGGFGGGSSGGGGASSSW